MVMVLEMDKGKFNDEPSTEALDSTVETLALAPALALQEHDFATASPEKPAMPVELANMDIEVFLELNEPC